jgi:hypothetical protein
MTANVMRKPPIVFGKLCSKLGAAIMSITAAPELTIAGSEEEEVTTLVQ